MKDGYITKNAAKPAVKRHEINHGVACAVAVVLIAVAIGFVKDRDLVPEASSGQSQSGEIAALESRPEASAADARLLVSNAAKNETANALLSGDDLPEGLVRSLCRMAFDPSYDDCWRDYCLQFLGVALARRGDDVSEEDSRLALSSLRRAAGDLESASAGTALLSLRSAAASSGDRRLSAEVSEIAVRTAFSDEASDPARLTALLVLESGGHPKALEAARRLSALRQSGLLHETALEVAKRISHKMPK